MPVSASKPTTASTPSWSYIEFEGGVPVEFPEEHTTATLLEAPLGERMFRIESVPVMLEEHVSYGDTIEADATLDGGLRFIRVTKRGGWRTYDFLLSSDLVESDHIVTIQNRVLSHGGHWERVFGGLLFLCLPPTTDYDPTEDICNDPRQL